MMRFMNMLRGVSLWFCQPLVGFRHAAARPAGRALSQVVSRVARPPGRGPGRA